MIKNIALRVVKILLIFPLILSSSGCVGNSLDHENPTSTHVTPTETVIAEQTTNIEATSTFQEATLTTEEPEGAIEDSITQYLFEATLDYNKHTLQVVESIRYKNSTGKELTQIPLMVPPNSEKGVFVLNSILENGNPPLKEYGLDGVVLTLDLEQTLKPDEIIEIDIEYLLKPKINGGILGYTAKSINFSDWYPFIPPYDADGGWIIHQPAQVGEYLVYEMADFDLSIHLTGKTGLVIAASTQVFPLAIDQYQMVSENARNITFSVSDRYTVLNQEVEGITVRGYVFQGDEESGWAAVNTSANALQLFGDLFGQPYLHETFTVVESDFPDGMEYDGLYYLSDFYFKNFDGSFQNYLSLLSVHETSHQWWFGLVGNDQALEPWLDESLATYSEYLYIEQVHPELEDWWWQYRVETYHPSGRVNLSIYDTLDLRTYINAVYLQGAEFVNELRNTLGDDTFFSDLRIYLEDYTDKIATWKDFISIFESSNFELVQNEVFKRFNFQP